MELGRGKAGTNLMSTSVSTIISIGMMMTINDSRTLQNTMRV
jgi:hypothetical protein